MLDLRTSVVCLALCSLPAVAPAAAAARGLPKVLSEETANGFKLRPATIGYTGDGSGLLGGTDGTDVRDDPGRLHWTTYNRHVGIATGVVWADDCDPDCADGTFNPFPATIRVTAPKNGHFTRLTIHSTEEDGTPYLDRRVIRRIAGSGGYPGYWIYAILGS